MANIDWAKLVAQGRAKAYGVSWTEEEAIAVSKGIPAEYVRKGILTLADYEKAKDTLSKEPAKTKDELMAEAKKEGIAVTPDATKESLEKVVADKKAAKPEKVEKPKEVKTAAPAKKPVLKVKAKPVKKTVKR